jgi:hypothetical protein
MTENSLVTAKSEASIKQALKGLRRIVESSDDASEKRIAYAVEQAIRWVIEDTVDWNSPEEDVPIEAKFLCNEIADDIRKFLLKAT